MPEHIEEHLGGKAGLRIIVEKESDLPALIQQKIVTRELLEKHGFLLLENCGGPINGEPHERKLTDDTSLQFIHKDRSGTHHSIMTIVDLRFPVQEKKRGSFTAIGDSALVLPRMAQFILEDPSPAHPALAAVQTAIKETGIQNLEPSAIGPNGHTWADSVFFHLANTVRGKGYPQLHALYEHLSDVLYMHQWKHGQRLLIHDDRMVHGRVPIEDATKKGGFLFQSHRQWEEGVTP